MGYVLFAVKVLSCGEEEVKSLAKNSRQQSIISCQDQEVDKIIMKICGCYVVDATVAAGQILNEISEEKQWALDAVFCRRLSGRHNAPKHRATRGVFVVDYVLLDKKQSHTER